MRRGDLRHRDAPVRARWNWGWLEGCFSDTKISASDIDAIWERRGKFLVVEVKRPGEPLSLGQLLLLRRLAEAKNFTVVLVRGEKDTPAVVQRITADGLASEEHSSQGDFRQRVARWFSTIEGVDSPAPEPLEQEAPPAFALWTENWKPTEEDLENARYWGLDNPDPE